MTGLLTDLVAFDSPVARGVAITGYPSIGSVAGWSDGGQIWTATYQGDVAPMVPQVIGAAWKSFYTPTLAFMVESDAVYIAWVDENGNVNASSSADGWDPNRFFNFGFGATGRPAMTHVPGTIYVTWPWENRLQIRSFAPDYGAVPDDPQTGQSANGVWQMNGDTGIICDNGEHALFALDGKVYVTTGGSVEKGAAPARIYVAAEGIWFKEVIIPAISCIGAPQMAFVGDTYHLVWVDGANGAITHAATRDLSTFAGEPLGQQSRGGVAMVGEPSGLVMAWPADSLGGNAVCSMSFARLPLEGGAGAEAAALAALGATRARRVQVQDCGPLAVYDIEKNECVDRLSPRGKCLLSSFMGNGLINPISLAICLIRG